MDGRFFLPSCYLVSDWLAQAIGISAGGLIGVAVIVAGSGKKARFAKLLTWNPAIFTGKISYALYLWHYPLIVFCLTDWPKLNPLIPAAAAYAIAALSYFTVEEYFLYH